MTTWPCSEVISRLPQSKGYEVSTAPTGLEGLRLTRQWLPDLVLLDVQLPDLDGFEVCRQIKADPALLDVFVIMLSGEATSASQKAGGLDTGADEYLTKPLDAQELMARIRTAARLRHTTAALRASEQHYRRLVEILPDAVGLLDAEGRLVAVNPQALSMLGYSDAGLLLGKNALQLAPPEEQARFRAELAQALRKGPCTTPNSPSCARTAAALPAEISAAVSSEGREQPRAWSSWRATSPNANGPRRRLRALPRRIIEAQEAERQRVARDLHDGVNQIIASAKMRLPTLSRPSPRSILPRRPGPRPLLRIDGPGPRGKPPNRPRPPAQPIWTTWAWSRPAATCAENWNPVPIIRSLATSPRPPNACTPPSS